MKIETQPLEEHQVKLTVEVEPDMLAEAKQRAGRQLARRVKIPGFRPGKAPYAMVVRHLGEAAIMEEATELLVNDVYPKALDESGIEPYGPGSLENILSLEPPTFEFIIPLKAEVELGDYRSIRIPYEPNEVGEEDVERVISDLLERQALLEPVERPAQEGDMVYIRLNGQRKQAEEGKDPDLVKDRSLPVLIDAEDADTSGEWPFPGFSRQLIGMSAGDQKELSYTFPEESDYESLRGVEAEFQVVVEEIKSRTLPELNDEFAQSVGEYTDLKDLRARIRQDLEKQARDAYHEDYDQQVLEQVTDQATIKYPPQMLEREIDNVIDRLKERLAQQNLELDLYLKTRQMDMEALREESRPVAESRLKKTLVLLEASDVEQVQVDQEELQAETTRTLDMMSRVLPEKEVRKLSDREVVSNLVGNIMMDMVTNRTLELLRDIASGKAEQEAVAEASPEATEAAAEAEQEAVAEAGPAEIEAAAEAEIETSEEAAAASPTASQAAPDALAEEVPEEQTTPETGAEADTASSSPDTQE